MKVNVNGRDYEVVILGKDASVNGRKIKVDQARDELAMGQDRFFLDYIGEGDPSLFVINGMAYLVSRTVSEEAEVRDVNAPINGQIIDVFAEAGRKVARGELLVTLEAMKMENQIKSPYSGMIKEVKVKKGQLVKTGDILVTFFRS